MDQTARLDLPFIISGQALKHITHNDALERLDALVQPVVEAMSLSTPPMSPLPGEAWVVPAGAGGAWAGHGDEIAAFQSGAWRFFDPATGWQVFDRATGTLCVYSSTGWVAVAATGSGLPRLGIQASADDTNRLAISAQASLFSHAGAGHQLKINKAATGDTASLLFQSNWSGRAEMGLMGDNGWRIKVSADGASWSDAVAINASTSAVTFSGHLLPAADNARSLGASGARWAALWSATGTIQTSDARDKTDIAPSALGLDFILALRPVQYRWRDQQAAGLFHGFLAHQVAAALPQDLAGQTALHQPADPADPDSRAALRYDNLIAPLIASVQALHRRVVALETLCAPQR